MQILAIAAYLWVGVWTGILILGQYKPTEPMLHKIVGPIVFGAAWPIGLPFAVLGHHGPADFGLGAPRS